VIFVAEEAIDRIDYDEIAICPSPITKRRDRAHAMTNRSMDTPPYRVGRSQTGLGLFATVPIKKHALIVEYFRPAYPGATRPDQRTTSNFLWTAPTLTGKLNSQYD
jgi:hypothetical protein